MSITKGVALDTPSPESGVGVVVENTGAGDPVVIKSDTPETSKSLAPVAGKLPSNSNAMALLPPKFNKPTLVELIL